MHSGWGPEVLGTPLGPGPRFPRAEESLVRRRWKIHVSSSCYSSPGYLTGPERMELVALQTGLTMAEVDAVLVVPGSGVGPGHTLDIPADIHSDIRSDIHSGSGISGTVRTSWHGFVCLNMERLLLILNMTKNQMLFGFQWNCVS